MAIKELLPSFMIGDTTDAVPTKTSIYTEKGQNYNLHPLEVIQLVLTLEEALFTDSILTVNDLEAVLQSQDLIKHPLIRSQP